MLYDLSKRYQYKQTVFSVPDGESIQDEAREDGQYTGTAVRP